MDKKRKQKSADNIIGGIFNCHYDEHFTLIDAEEDFLIFLGYTRSELEEKFHSHLADMICEEDREKTRREVKKQLSSSDIFMNENRIVIKNGEVRWIWISGELMQEKGRTYIHCMFHDINQEREAQDELALLQQRYEIILSQTQDIIFELNCVTNEIYYSPNFEKKFGYQIPTNNFPDSMFETDIIYKDDRAMLRERFQSILKGKNHMHCEYRLKTKDNTYLWMNVQATALRDENGRLQKILGIISDIDERKQEILYVKREAVLDPLTNLLNRKEGARQIEKYICENQGLAAFLLIDVDNFKGVNDTLGHIYGDAVLSEISYHLKAMFRKEDIIARFGGDEFVVFITSINSKSDLISKINAIHNIFNRSIHENEIHYSISCSIGISFYPENGRTFLSLLEKSDSAMYQAKQNGKNQYYIYKEGGLPIKKMSEIDRNTESVPSMQKNFHDHIIEYVFRIFLENPENEKAIPVLLDLVGRLFHVDRAYIFEKTGKHSFKNTFEWCREGIPSMKNSLQQLQDKVKKELFKKDHMFVCEDTSVLEDKEVRKWFENRGAKAAVACCLKERDEILAVIGYEDCCHTRISSEEDPYTLSMISETISLFLIKERNALSIQKQQEFNERLLKNLNSSIYVIDPVTHHIIYLNDNMHNKIDVRVNDICYKKIRGFEEPCSDCPIKNLKNRKDRCTKVLYNKKQNEYAETSASYIEWEDNKEFCLLNSKDITQYCVNMDRVVFLVNSIAGGMQGGYMEEGFPFYFINQRMLEYLGYKDQEEYIQKIHGKIQNDIYEEDREEVYKNVLEQLKKNGEYEVEYRMIKKDGELIWVNDKGKKVVTADGREAVICLCMDISQQKEYENQLELYRNASNGGAFVICMDEELTLIYANDIFYMVHESTKEQLEKKGNHCTNYIYPEDLPRVRRILEDAIQHHKAGTQWEMRIITGKGNSKWILVKGTFEKQGDRLVMNGFVIDITEKHILEDKIVHKELVYRTALSQAHINIWEYDVRNHSLLLMESGEKRHGLKGRIKDVPYSLIEEGYIHPRSQKDLIDLYARLDRGEKYAQADILTSSLDHTYWWWERLTYTMLYDEQGKPNYAVAIGEDITKQKEAEMLYQRELQMRMAMNEGTIISFRCNLDKNRVEYIYGLPSEDHKKDMTYEELLRLHGEDIANEEDKQRFQKTMNRERLLAAFQQGKTTVSFEYRRKDKDGRLFWVNAVGYLIQDAQNGDRYVYGTLQNIDEKKKIELTLRNRAERDSLTKTYNKETAIQMMSEAIAKNHKKKNSYALLVFNVDNFTNIVHNSGYVVADEILKEMSSQLLVRFMDKKIVGRFYGDEIVVFVYDNPKPEYVCQFAEEVRKSMAMPYMFPNAKAPVSISIGIVFDNHPDTTFTSLYKKARIALGAAKSEGRNRYTVYTEKIGRQEIHAFHEEQQIEETPVNLQDKASENLLLKCLFSLTSSMDFKHAVENTLREIGTYYDGDRAYIIELKKDHSAVSHVYEWKKEDFISIRQTDSLLLHPTQMNDTIYQLFKGQQYLKDIETLKDKRPNIYKKLKERGIKSYFIAGLNDGDENIGYVGIDNPKKNMDNPIIIETTRYFFVNELLKRKLQKHQEYLSYHDDLTGALNRNSYKEYRENLSEEGLISLGVVSIDINGLKEINRKEGNTYGDHIVKTIAEILQESYPSDRVYRFTGDEFLVICENISNESFYIRLKSVRQRCDGICSTSIGSAWADVDIELDSLMKNADEKRLVVKQEYYNTKQFSNKRRSAALLKNLLEALNRCEFAMYLQPKIDIQNNQLYGAEALVRYQHPKLGVIPPIKFIPLLEGEGLIHYIDFFIFERVCATLKKWRDEEVPLIPISLNFSRSTLLEEYLIPRMEAISGKYGVERKYIEIEITESFGEVERDTVIRIGNQIRQLGYKISLDDFGAKYSNISFLSALYINDLKLDKSLVNDLISNPNTKAIVKNILSLCGELGINAVAEGVENQEQFEILKEMGCDYVQGYYFNKPIPLENFEQQYFLRTGED